MSTTTYKVQGDIWEFETKIVITDNKQTIIQYPFDFQVYSL
jgi:hypothetical protein